MNKCLLSVLAVIGSVSIISCGQDVIGEGAPVVNKADSLYARNRFDQATNSYRLFVEQNPDSPLRKAALLGLADSLYKDKEYFEAVLYYERFMELYPMDSLTPRAAFYMGMCYYHDSHSTDRDQTPTIDSINTFKLFAQRFPKHQLAPFAGKYLSEMEAKKSRSQLDVARFYAARNQEQAAIARLQKYIELYPDSADNPEALYLLGKSYFNKQSYKKAGLILTSVIKKYPDNEYASKAAELARELKLNK